jgi:hypothetical protein
VVVIEPCLKRAMFFLQGQHHLGVVYGSIHF